MTTGPASLYFVTCSTARGALDAENNKPMKTRSLKAHLATDQVNNSVIVTNNGIIYKGWGRHGAESCCLKWQANIY